MIRVSDIRRSFGALRALDGATFEARPGEVLGLLGPNGAGKSTLIAVCTGQLVPDAGTVDIMGLGSPLRPEVRRIIGIAPQQIALHDDLTARENLVFLGRIHGVREPVRRADELLARVGLLPRARDRVKSFSGGMQRRLNLAAALVHDPQAVFLDEPTAGVDPQSRTAILDAVRDLAEHGRTVVYTTHYMEEAERICSRIAVIDHGRVLAAGTAAELAATHAPDAAGAPGTLESAFLALTGRSLRD